MSPVVCPLAATCTAPVRGLWYDVVHFFARQHARAALPATVCVTPQGGSCGCTLHVSSASADAAVTQCVSPSPTKLSFSSAVNTGCASAIAAPNCYRDAAFVLEHYSTLCRSADTCWVGFESGDGPTTWSSVAGESLCAGCLSRVLLVLTHARGLASSRGGDVFPQLHHAIDGC